ncbi:hypothetical protein ACFL2V_19080, partial [Pseudomonadota bacterium]
MKKIHYIILTSIFLLNAQVASASLAISPGEANPTMHFVIEAGQSYMGEVIVFNKYDVTKTIVVSSVDSIRSPSGSLLPLANYDEKKGVGLWTSFNNTTKYEIPGSDNITIPFTLSIPSDTPIGTYGGALTVKEEIDKSSQNGDVSFSTRQAYLLTVNVPGETTTDIEISDLKYADIPGNNDLISFKIENNGNSTLLIRHVLSLSDYSGNEIDRFSSEEFYLYKNESFTKTSEIRNEQYIGKFVATLDVEISEYNFVTDEKVPYRNLQLSTTFTKIPWLHLGISLVGFLTI